MPQAQAFEGTGIAIVSIPVFGNRGIEPHPIQIIEDADSVSVSGLDDGLTYIIFKDYSQIFTDSGSQVVMNERWILEYKQGNTWKPRGTPLSVSYVEQENMAWVTRFYTDYLGTTWNVTYWFQSGVKPKITFQGVLDQEEDYRIVWSLSGINTTYYEVYESNVKFLSEADETFIVDIEDVYNTLGDICDIVVTPQANNHKADFTFNIGVRQGYFELDPTFGNTNTESSAFDIDGYLAGSIFTLTESATVDLISVYAYVGSSTSIRIKCMIYDDTLDLVLTSDEYDPPESTADWFNCTVTSSPTLSAGDYWLTVWTAGSGSYIYYHAGTTDQWLQDAIAYNGVPDPVAPDSYEDRETSIYADYTAVGGGTDYPVGVTQSISSSWDVSIGWLSTVGLSQAIASTWDVASAWLSTIGLTQTIGFNWAVSTGWLSGVGLTQAISTSFDVSILKGFAVGVSQVIGSSWTVTVGWLSDVGLTQAIFSIWAVTVDLPVLGGGLGSIAFILAIVALALVVTVMVSKS